MFLSWLIVFVIVEPAIAAGIIFVPDPGGRIAFSVIGGIFTTVMILVAAWIPHFFRSLEYAVDDDEVRMRLGVFWKRRVTVPFRKITNVDITEGPLQRHFGIATIHIQTAGAGGQQGGRAELRMAGVRDADGIRERILSRLRPVTPAAQTNGADATPEKRDEAELLAAILDEIRELRKSMEGRS